MKKIIATLLVGMIVLLMAAPVQAAASTNVLKGTPTVDGLLDDMYLESAFQSVEDTYIWSWGYFMQGAEMPSEGTVYFLWDEDYLYVCGVVTDDTRASQEGEKTWQNDSIEHWLKDGGLNFKIHHAGDDNIFLGTDADGQASFDVEKIVHASTYTDTGYIIEAAFPMTDLAAGKTFGYRAQLNDIFDDSYTDGYAKGSPSTYTTYTCVDENGATPAPTAPATVPAETTPVYDGPYQVTNADMRAFAEIKDSYCVEENGEFVCNGNMVFGENAKYYGGLEFDMAITFQKDAGWVIVTNRATSTDVGSTSGCYAFTMLDTASGSAWYLTSWAYGGPNVLTGGNLVKDEMENKYGMYDGHAVLLNQESGKYYSYKFVTTDTDEGTRASMYVDGELIIDVIDPNMAMGNFAFIEGDATTPFKVKSVVAEAPATAPAETVPATTPTTGGISLIAVAGLGLVAASLASKKRK